MKLLHDGEVVGEIVTNRSLTLEECFELLNINLDDEDEYGFPKWDYELFSMDHDISSAAAALGRKGGSAKTEAKQKASRENGKKGGRPKKTHKSPKE